MFVVVGLDALIRNYRRALDTLGVERLNHRAALHRLERPHHVRILVVPRLDGRLIEYFLIHQPVEKRDRPLGPGELLL